MALLLILYFTLMLFIILLLPYMRATIPSNNGTGPLQGTHSGQVKHTSSPNWMFIAGNPAGNKESMQTPHTQSRCRIRTHSPGSVWQVLPTVLPVFDKCKIRKLSPANYFIVFFFFFGPLEFFSVCTSNIVPNAICRPRTIRSVSKPCVLPGVFLEEWWVTE